MNALVGRRPVPPVQSGQQAELQSELQAELPAALRSTAEKDCLTVVRVAVAAILVSLLWKISFFLVAGQVYFRLPMRDDFFPLWLQSATVSTGAFAATVAALTGLLISNRLRVMIRAAIVSLAGLTVLCLHQHAYNDMTFITCWWSAVWCLWMLVQTGRRPEGQLRRGVFMAHLLLSVILLGGAVGKMSPGYWSGEVFYGIYFGSRDFWVYNLLRGQFDESTLRTVSCTYSRMVIVTELACGGLWLLPPRWASSLAIVVMLGIALMSNVWLFSVLTCLIGLAIAGLHQTRPDRVPAPPG